MAVLEKEGLGKLVLKSAKGSVKVFMESFFSYIELFAFICIMLCLHTYEFKKTTISEDHEDKMILAGKLSKYGISLLEYSRNIGVISSVPAIKEPETPRTPRRSPRKVSGKRGCFDSDIDTLSKRKSQSDSDN